MAEAQLRAEVMSLRRQNTSLTKRVHQLQGLLGELQSLWLEAPEDIQQQVQSALMVQTPRVSVAPTPLEDSPSVAETPGRRRAEGIRKAQCVTVGVQTEACQATPAGTPAASGRGSSSRVPKLGLGGQFGGQSFQPAARKASDDSELTPPNTARHRMDSDASDASSVGDVGDIVAIGEVTVSPEHYKAVCGALQEEAAARADLEQQVVMLSARGPRPSENSASPARPETLSRLERALEREAESRSKLVNCMDTLSQEWAWHELKAETWGHVASRGERLSTCRSTRLSGGRS